MLGAPLVAGGTERLVVRDELVPPFDPRDYPSPLSAFREFVKEDADAVLFTVTGLPESARVRLATMDRYDGVVWNVAGDGSAQASGEFRRVGAEIETNVRGDRAHVDIAIGALGGVWLPTVGQATSIDLADPDDAGALRYNDATGAAVLTGGLREGLEYGVDVVVPREPDDTEVGSAPESDVAQPPLAGVPDIAAVTAADVARDAGNPVQISSALATWLSEQGFFSHGMDVSGTESLSGHGADRITTLLGGDLMVGDGEQYAAAMALMAREMGLPARVVLGFIPEDGASEGPVEVTGDDVQAWVEVAFQGYGWVAFDPTPPPEQTPQEEDQEKPSEPNPQVVQPPPPPPAAVTPPDEDTEQPQTDDPDAEDDGNALLWRIARVAGIVGGPAAGAGHAAAGHRRAQGPATASASTQRGPGGPGRRRLGRGAGHGPRPAPARRLRWPRATSRRGPSRRRSRTPRAVRSSRRAWGRSRGRPTTPCSAAMSRAARTRPHTGPTSARPSRR